MRRVDRKRLKRNGRDAGYTLTEMLVVIGIIGLIAAVLTPGLISQLSRARAKAAQMQLKNLASAVELFREDVGRYPTASEGLRVLVDPPNPAGGWSGPYLESQESLADPWGGRVTYTLEASGRRFFVSTLGADGAAGGEGSDRDLRWPAARR